MSKHIRQAIREAVAAALRGNTSAGDQVYETRLYALQPDDMPGIAVFTSEDDVSSDNRGRGEVIQDRKMTVEIICVAALLNDVEDRLDTMALEVEQVMEQSGDFSGLVLENVLAKIETQFSMDGTVPNGQLRLTYKVRAKTLEGDPTGHYQ